MVALRGVSHRYREGDRDHTVLRHVDLRVERGESVALEGRSGSGKTTLLNVIGTIDRPREGRVQVEGRELTGLDERGRALFRRRRLGFVHQFFNLLPTLRVAENVRLPVELAGGTRREARRAAAELLEAVGLADRLEAFPDALSGGEQQRVAIARALIHGPALVLADEPTGNLDAETGDRVLDLLGRLARERGSTLLLATHSPEVAGRAGRVLRLRDGQLEPGGSGA